jgi:hypothetical protein
MNRSIFGILLFVNGLLLGSVLGILVAQDQSPAPSPPPPPPPTPNFHYEETADGRVTFFDQTSGRHISFNRVDDLWFVMTYDPLSGTVTYTKTKLVEDDSFLEAAELLKEALPGRLGREFLLGTPGK